MLKIPNHIQLLINNDFLEEVFSVNGQNFDREDIRIFKVIETKFICIIRLRPKHKLIKNKINFPPTVDWTDQTLSEVSFLDVFDQCPDGMKEQIILDMDIFYDQKV